MIPRPPRRRYEGNLPVVRERSQEYPLSEHNLEMGIREGRISLDTLVQFEPWTGQDFVPVWQIAELHDACRSPHALLIDHLSQAVIPWASIVLFMLLLVIGLLQQRGWLGSDIVVDSTMGWSNTVISGRWWTPWLSQVVHLNVFHWIGNISILFYCAFRVERAFGFWSVWMSASLALFFETVLILLFGQDLVLGSSGVVFGVWACQVAIGFRLAEILPGKYRGMYGWGNFFFFAPLLMINIMSVDVSHLAHIGGILAGCLVGFFSTSESMVAAKERRPLRRFLQVIIPQFLLLGFVSVYSLPSFASFPEQVINRKDSGLILQLPKRMMIDTWQSMTIWRGVYQEETMIFADSFWLSSRKQVESKELMAWWEGKVEGEVKEVDKGFPSKEGWDDFYLQANDLIIWERVYQKGRYLIRTGCTFRNEDFSRQQHCLYWLNSIYPQEPLELEQARIRYQQFSQTPSEAFEYGSMLLEFGEEELADQLYQKLSYRNDDARWRALFERLLIRLNSTKEYTWNEDKLWVKTLFQQIPISQRRLFEVAVLYTNSHHQCDVVNSAWRRWERLLPQEDPAMYNLVELCQK